MSIHYSNPQANRSKFQGCSFKDVFSIFSSCFQSFCLWLCLEVVIDITLSIPEKRVGKQTRCCKAPRCPDFELEMTEILKSRCLARSPDIANGGKHVGSRLGHMDLYNHETSGDFWILGPFIGASYWDDIGQPFLLGSRTRNMGDLFTKIWVTWLNHQRFVHFHGKYLVISSRAMYDDNPFKSGIDGGSSDMLPGYIMLYINQK